MTLTSVKAMIAKVSTVAVMAGVCALASPARADAQVSFGVRLGGPVVAYGHVRPYYAPRYGYGYDRAGFGPGYYGPRYGYYRHEERERFYHGRGFYGR